ncbi:CMRF35-like molecule 2 isoform X3 [Alosa sapidissima]|uniref:CMRF35-like molecule 2 isoform X3 n=1 Tax=Alosa sapidissima TaxID=34773 RepID=UPI001C08325C|nr:CMRF35-like molecule 2 isoform X3 [Alosa sapidissima]
METPFMIILFCLLAGVHPVESVIQMTGDVGKSAVIRCPYDRGYEGYSKYLCKGSCLHLTLKSKIVKTEAGQTKAINGRLSLHDNTTAGVFTVTITGLTAEDSGQYWCGVKTGFGKADVFSGEVELKVQKVLPPTPNSTPVPSTEDHTLSSPSTAPTSNTSQTQHVLETNISDNAFKDQLTADEPRDVPENSVVMVILCVLVLLVIMTVCGLVSALYYRQRRRKKQTAACGPSSLNTIDHMGEVRPRVS